MVIKMKHFFEGKIGCEVIEHRTAYREWNVRMPPFLRCVLRIFTVCLGLVGLIGLMRLGLFYVETRAQLGALLRWNGYYGAFLLVAVCGLSYVTEGINHPEQFTLRFADELSAASLLEIKEHFQLEKTKEERVWIATPKKR